MRTVSLLCLMALSLSSAPRECYLLVDSAEIAAAREKAASQPWAREALDRVQAAAEKALKDPIDLPDRGGQWTHWYSCKKDGVQLETLSPTEHRCPLCATVYSGEPYDSVALSHRHSAYGRDVLNLGLAYRFSGRKELAQRAGGILSAYADRYPRYPRHNVNAEDKVGGGRVFAQTLDESVWLIPVTWGYALVRDSLSEAERRHIEEGLLLPAADLILEHRMGIHNIQCWKNSAVGLVGFATQNDRLVREAIDDPDRGFRVQIEKGVTDDGLWYEGSLGYHQYTMRALWPLAEAARHAGIDLYSDRMRSLFDAPLSLALPDGESPGFNDSRGGNLLGMASLYEIAYARWQKPAYGYLLARSRRDSTESLLYGEPSVPSGPMIPEQSTLLRSAGFAVLRDAGMAVAVRFGMHGGGHGHPDKLNLVTFGAGRLFGLDPGSINYGVPLHREWYRSTIAHNTVSVDMQPQQAADGRLESWESSAGSTRLAAITDSAYPGVILRRAIRLGAGKIEDRFECASAEEHAYDWVFHSAGLMSLSLNPVPRAAPLGTTNGYQHIRELSEARTEGDWWVQWQEGNARLTLRMRGHPGTEIFTGIGVGRTSSERVPMIIVRRRTTSTTFEAEHLISSLP